MRPPVLEVRMRPALSLGGIVVLAILAGCGGGSGGSSKSKRADPKQYTCADVSASTAKTNQLAVAVATAVPQAVRRTYDNIAPGMQSVAASELNKLCQSRLKPEDAPYQAAVQY